MTKSNAEIQAEAAERLMHEMVEQQIHHKDCVHVHDEVWCHPNCPVVRSLKLKALACGFLRIQGEVRHGKWWGSGEPDQVVYSAYELTREQVAARHNIAFEDVNECTGWGARLTDPLSPHNNWEIFDTEKEARDHIDQCSKEKIGEDTKST